MKHKYTTIMMVMGCILLLMVGHVHGGLLLNDYYKADGYTYDNGIFTFTSDYVWANFDVTTEDFFWRGDTRVAKSDIQEIGYYKVTDTSWGLISGTTVKKTGSDMYVLWEQDDQGNITTNNSTIFNKNDKIGIYMNINGKYYSSTSTSISGLEKADVTNVDLDGNHFGMFADVWKDGIGHYEYFLEGVLTSRKGETSETFMQRVNQEIEARNYDIQVTTSTGQVIPLSGGPLPDVLVTLVLGGAVLAGGYFMNRRHMKSLKHI